MRVARTLHFEYTSCDGKILYWLRNWIAKENLVRGIVFRYEFIYYKHGARAMQLLCYIDDDIVIRDVQIKINQSETEQYRQNHRQRNPLDSLKAEYRRCDDDVRHGATLRKHASFVHTRKSTVSRRSHEEEIMIIQTRGLASENVVRTGHG